MKKKFIGKEPLLLFRLVIFSSILNKIIVPPEGREKFERSIIQLTTFRLASLQGLCCFARQSLWLVRPQTGGDG